MGVARVAHRFCSIIKDLLGKKFNNNIYTRILFSNLLVFLVSLIALMLFADFMVKQISYEQVQQDLLHKAKRVNFALQQLQAPTTVSEQARIDFKSTQKDWEEAQSLFQIGLISKIEYDKAAEAYRRATVFYERAQTQNKQEMLRFLAELFDARITLFERTGNITATSAEQEVVPGSKVEERFIGALDKSEITIAREMEKKTGQLSFYAVVPMGNNQNGMENGILLTTIPPHLDLALNRMHLYLAISGVIILIIIIFISVYLAMYISMPISHLATTVTEISRGSEILAVEDQPLDEINTLAGQLNKLAIRLHKMQDESSKIEEERNRLFSEISHELRTPLTSVQGFVEAIRDGMVQDQVLLKKYLDTIYTQTVHINRLVDDILVLSRLENGNITIRKQPLDLITLVQSVIMSLEADANNKHTLIILEKQVETAIIHGDVDRMEQIIRNLLKNAIQATENGVIKVGIEVRQSEVTLTIADNGIGIAAGDLPHIWDRFYRAKNQPRGYVQEKGSGLGLVIVKKLVQLQGGAINVESALGKGTTFSITFPLFIQKQTWF